VNRCCMKVSSRYVRNSIGLCASISTASPCKAIPRLEIDDLDHILQNLVYCLPPFTSRKFNKRGSELLQLLLAEMVLPALREDSHSDTKYLSATRPVLQICEDLTCTLQVVPAVDLLHFFCTSLISKTTLQRMQVSDQQWVICSLARILGLAAEQPQNSQFLSLRQTITDACPYLLEVCHNLWSLAIVY